MPDQELQITEINRDIPIPLYYQLAQRLREEIEAHELVPGDFFTTDKVLQERFDLSRATVRQALEELINEGLLTRVSGKGTYVARPPIEITLPHLVSFSEEIRQKGMKPSTSVESARSIEPPRSVLEALELASNSRVLELRRLRYADGSPLVYMIDYLHPDLGLSEETDFNDCLFDIVETRCDAQLNEATHEITPVLVEDRLASLLEVPAGSPALRFVRTTYDVDRKPLIYEDAICRGDRYKYSVHLRREGGLRGRR